MKRIWFRHQSPVFFDVIKAQTYDELKKIRHNNQYVKERKMQELEYHALLGSNTNQSLNYLTIVGCHMMPKALKYLGYTYYSLLSEDQIEDCLFFVVEQTDTRTPIRGKAGLETAMKDWNDNNSKFESIFDELLDDYVDPRIEVITQRPIKCFRYVPQIEDRTGREIRKFK